MTPIEAGIRAALANPLKDDRTIDPHRVLADVLAAAGFDEGSGGGSVRFEGADPIISSPLPLATMAAASLMAKAVAMAAIWRLRTGEGQDLSVKLGQVLHRLCPFYDRKWELLNGYAPGFPHDPIGAFVRNPLNRSRDGRWVQFANIYPRSKTAALNFLDCCDDRDAVAAAIAQWDALDFEEAANAAGLQANMVRNTEEFLATDQFAALAPQPLIEIVKIGESDPIPFTPDPKTPLDGIRALGLGHVIAGAGLGRAMAYHGADVLNVWRPNDFEFDLMYCTANVGMRSSTIEIGEEEGMARFRTLLRDADVFFANRRPGYCEKLGLGPEEVASFRPGIIHVEMSLFGWSGPWADRIGFDNNAGGITGVYTLEGSAEQPKLTEIGVVNDYAMAWLSLMGVAAALKRRAEEGGSYRIRISLARMSLWLLSLGLFDKEYALKVAGTAGTHEYLAPDLFRADTPMGDYQGVTDQVFMSRTPGGYAFPLVAKGSSKAAWL